MFYADLLASILGAYEENELWPRQPGDNCQCESRLLSSAVGAILTDFASRAYAGVV